MWGPPACGGEYLAWEPYSHKAFRFNEASSGSIRAFAEDYLIKPTATGCHLIWVMAMQPNSAAARLGMSLGRPVMSWLFQRFLYKPARLLVSAVCDTGLALPGRPRILDVISRQLVVQMQAAVQGGVMTATDAATLTAWMNAGIKQIRTGTPPFPAPGPVPIPHATDFTALMQSAIQSNVYGSDPSQMVLTHSFPTRYGKEFDAIDPTALAAAVRVPTVVTCGSKDLNTPCEAGQPAGTGVRTLAGAFRPDLAHLVELPDVVHILRDVGDADPPDLAAEATYPFSPVLATSFDAFMATFVHATPPPTTSPPPSARPASLQAPSGKRLLIG